MLIRGSIVAFPATDPRREIRALRAMAGAVPPDALVALQGGPHTRPWGYVTCALAWRADGRGARAHTAGDDVHLSAGFTASTVLLHRFPAAWLGTEPDLGQASAPEVDELVECFIAACGAPTPERSPRFARGTVFTGEAEVFIPESAGYSGALQAIPGKAFVALWDIAQGAAGFPAVVATTQAPPASVARWVVARTVKRDRGRRTTIWIQCHEVRTHPAHTATIRNLFWWFQRYPLTAAEVVEVVAKVHDALRVGRA